MQSEQLPAVFANARSAPASPAIEAAMVRRVTPLHAALTVLAVLAVGMMLSWPLGYDQGVFASVGDVVARGGAPYRDAWDVKGPLEFYGTAAIDLLFGRHAWGIRLVDVTVALVTAGMLWHRLDSVISRGAALTAALLWPIMLASLHYEAAAQYDVWIGSAMLGVTLLTTRRGAYRPRDLALAGVLIGLATLIKPIFPVFLAIPGVVVLMHRRAAPVAVARDLTYLLAGFVAPIVATMAALWVQGALREAWEVHIMYNLRVYAPNNAIARVHASSPNAMRVLGLITYLVQPKVAIVIAPAAAGAFVLWRTQRVLAAAMLTWLVSGIALVLLQNKFWIYHWGIVYPALLALVVVGVDAARRDALTARSRAGVLLVSTMAGVAFTLWAGDMAIDLRRWMLFAAGRHNAAWYAHTLLQYGEIDPGDAAAAAAYIRAHTPPDAPFAEWTLQAGMPFLAGRPHVSRFFNKRELTNTRDHPITRAYRAEYLRRVVDLRPAYIAVDKTSDYGAKLTAAGQTFTPQDVLAYEFPELAAVVTERYEVAAHFGAIDVYRLRTALTSPPAAASGAP